MREKTPSKTDEKPVSKRKNGEAVETPAFGSVHDKGFFRDFNREITEVIRGNAKI